MFLGQLRRCLPVLAVSLGLSVITLVPVASAAGSAAGWRPTASMSVARANHAATLLGDGRVLAAGGIGSTSYLGSAELYDPSTGSWTPTGAMATARADHTMTLLTSGRVLVAGGRNQVAILASAELYDPAGGGWAPAGGMTAARTGATATRLSSGRVLVAGGSDA